MKKLEADIYQGENLVGTISRTAQGSITEFLPEVATNPPKYPGMLAANIPYSTLPLELVGDNLHPFFVNLLPEGNRLNLLLSNNRVAKDDFLGILILAGQDTIGDVSVRKHGEPHTRVKELTESTNFESAFRFSVINSDPHIAGVQEKISDATIVFPSLVKKAPCLIKFNPSAFPHLVENEHFFLNMAKSCGIPVNNSSLKKDSVGASGLLIQRFDREKVDGKWVKLHQEDLCQITNNMPANKYRLSMREVVEAISELVPQHEILQVLERYAFSYLIGNSDLHAKNLSLIWHLNGIVKLSPAYDMLSTLPYKNIARTMALKLDGKDNKFKSRDFIAFGLRYGIPEPATKMMLSKLKAKAASWIPKLTELPYDAKTTEFLQQEIESRRAALIP